ncbi:MAG: HAD family hydrolase, partial [Chloroflexota bacterium]
MTKIKAILFDFDGTLHIHLPSGGEVFTDYAITQGLVISDDDRLRGLRWEHYYFASSPEIQEDVKMFKDDKDGFWTNYSRRRFISLGCHPDRAVELSTAASAYMAESYKPSVHVPDELHQVLPMLQNEGYILGVVSNRDEPYPNELAETGLAQYFKFSLAGGEVSSFKPDPAIFMHALEMAGTSPEETLYVGDNYYADVVGSQRAGLQPVLYDPAAVFPDADCPVIKSFDELRSLIVESKIS